MSREEWITAAEARLHQRCGAPENENQRKNMRGWAEAIYANYEQDGDLDTTTPKDAVDEDLSYA
jgi:hypothetical protein